MINDLKKMRAENLITHQSIEKLRQFPIIVLWGTANAARYAFDYLTTKGLNSDYVTDSFFHQKGEMWNGLPLINKEDVFSFGASAIVVIGCSYAYGVDKLLEAESINYVAFDTNLLGTDVFSERSHYVSAKEELLRSFDKIEYVYRSLQDEKSKETLYNILSYRITLDRALLAPIYDSNTYWGNDVIQSLAGDTVIDCGAYNGDTMEHFFQRGCSCNTYIALEPSPMYFEALKSCIKKNNYKNVLPFPVAAWDKKGYVSFSQTNGGASHVSGAGELMVQTDTIDSISAGRRVDCIKMDIEGAEIPALNGAVHSIRTYRPVVTASIYHQLSDLWEIPLLLKKMCPAYQLFIRHQSPWGDDTVVYAVCP